MPRLEARVRRLERATGEGERRGYSHHQLVLLSFGATLEETGPPEQVLKPGQRSIAELILEAGGSAAGED